MTEANVKLLGEILANPEAEEKLSNAGSVENMLSIFSEYGLEMTYDEAMEIINQNSSDELSEASLESVAGGASWWKKAWGQIRDAFNGFVDGFNSRAW